MEGMLWATGKQHMNSTHIWFEMLLARLCPVAYHLF